MATHGKLDRPAEKTLFRDNQKEYCDSGGAEEIYSSDGTICWQVCHNLRNLVFVEEEKEESDKKNHHLYYGCTDMILVPGLIPFLYTASGSVTVNRCHEPILQMWNFTENVSFLLDVFSFVVIVSIYFLI